MTQSRATSVEQYLAELPPERRTVVASLRDLVNAHLPAGYEEGISWGMICWGIPLSRYPDTYNGQPLGYVALAAQKNYYALYLTCLYMDPEQTDWFAREFKAAGKKLDMGKSCVRFRAIDDLPLETVAQAIARTSPDEYIARYEDARAATKGGARQAAKKSAKVAATKSAKVTAKKSAKPAAKKAAAKKR